MQVQNTLYLGWQVHPQMLLQSLLPRPKPEELRLLLGEMVTSLGSTLSCDFFSAYLQLLALLVDSASCDFFCCVVVTVLVPFPPEGYQNPCLPAIFFGLILQMLLNTEFAVRGRLHVLHWMRNETHQRPILPSRALPSNQWRHSHVTNKAPSTLLLGLRVL